MHIKWEDLPAVLVLMVFPGRPVCNVCAPSRPARPSVERGGNANDSYVLAVAHAETLPAAE